jgi:hypothetical protein
MIELDLTGRGTGRDSSNILRVGLPVTHRTAVAVAVSEGTKIPWPGAGGVAERQEQKQKHKILDHARTKELRGASLSAAVPSDLVDLIRCNNRLFLMNSRPSGTVESNTSSIKR